MESAASVSARESPDGLLKNSKNENVAHKQQSDLNEA